VLRVLHLEDNSADAELIHTVLRQEWPDCRIRHAQSRADFVEAAQQGQFDVVLSDFSLPQFDGLSALELVRGRNAITPFIFLSGAIGEERAIEALNRGATDYVLKDRPGRLVPAIRQALARVDEMLQRQRAEEALREQASLLDKARDAIVALGLDQRISYWNASAERLYGWRAADVFGRTLDSLALGHEPSRFAAARAQVLDTGEWRGDFQIRTRSGEFVQVESRWSLVLDADAGPRAILLIDTDVTEKRKLETQLLRADRMDSLGMLAGSIAHDLNNILTPILMGSDLLRLSVSDEVGRQIVENIEAGARHGSALVRQLIAFARGTEGEQTEIRVPALIEDVRTLLRQSLLRNIQLTTTTAETLWPLRADATQIKQVLLNLCLNARDAMPAGGRLEIRAENCMVDASTARFHPGAEAGPHVLIAVGDSGTGIPPTLIEKIFDPFFTTKATGKGTGLGLSTVAGIVKSHHGFLTVESEVGRGTTFRLFFPAHLQAVAPTTRSSSPFVATARGETVLLLDDDPGVRESFRFLLEKAGYRVLAEADGRSAVAAFTREAGRVAIVVTDMTMPGMGGLQVASAIRQIRPTQTIIAMAGWIAPDELETLRAFDPPVEFVAKPLTAEAFLETLRRNIAGAATPPVHR
jgi:PAS domain S-box-containing protein